jgi:cytochrome c biogenesis protein CcmG, thiol:disulfide interchange protein DsbE
VSDTSNTGAGEPVAAVEPAGKARFLIPLAIFVVLAGFLFVGLGLNPREVPSPFIGKPAPQFTLAKLAEPDKTFSPADMKGKVWLLNVWASWCVACQQEHPLLVEIDRAKTIPIVGLNYKDKPAAARNWLVKWGDPYALSVKDLDGRIGIEYGVYGVPETFVIDKQGVIRYKHIGPITPDSWRKKIQPLLQELAKS